MNSIVLLYRLSLYSFTVVNSYHYIIRKLVQLNVEGYDKSFSTVFYQSTVQFLKTNTIID